MAAPLANVQCTTINLLEFPGISWKLLGFLRLSGNIYIYIIYDSYENLGTYFNLSIYIGIFRYLQESLGISWNSAGISKNF